MVLEVVNIPPLEEGGEKLKEILVNKELIGTLGGVGSGKTENLLHAGVKGTPKFISGKDFHGHPDGYKGYDDAGLSFSKPITFLSPEKKKTFDEMVEQIKQLSPEELKNIQEHIQGLLKDSRDKII